MPKHQIKTESVIDDYRLLEIEVDTLAKLVITCQIHEATSEASLTPTLSPSNLKSRQRKTKIILDPNGAIVYPQSLYLVSRLSGQGKIKDTSSIAKALLAYSRFLDSTHFEQVDINGDVIPPEYLTYKSLTKHEEEGAPWRFAEFLLENTRHRNSEGTEAFALSTAKSYMNSVIGFYKWLQRFGYIKNDQNHVVTNFSRVTLKTDLNSTQHDILSHIKSNRPRQIDMSHIMQIFPRADSTPSYKKLKPITIDHLYLFDKYIDDLPQPFSLMFRLAIKTGTRIGELCHFPAQQIGEIDASGLAVVPVQITVTKFNKPRIIEVPINIYEELEVYKFSQKRINNASMRSHLILSENILDSSDKLFLSNKGRTYSEKTLEKHFSTLRQSIREIDSSWYYRIHDLRSTYATNWLRNESKEREVGYDFLMNELASLMGHENTATTEKYVKLMNEVTSQHSAAKRKNNKFNGGW
ncbi:tyrosine-type recombinase/integrase [Shewanella sp. 10N.286.45.A1]|uniref:tyrosine-type recombinase/integrase n=1 Tax=Shewanella sp. 10N.286.45.A1 TaxID=3229694 RepID=UPI00354D4342